MESRISAKNTLATLETAIRMAPSIRLQHPQQYISGGPPAGAALSVATGTNASEHMLWFVHSNGE